MNITRIITLSISKWTYYNYINSGNIRKKKKEKKKKITPPPQKKIQTKTKKKNNDMNEEYRVYINKEINTNYMCKFLITIRLLIYNLLRSP